MKNNKTKSLETISEGEKRVFSGYLSTYGNKDRDGDVFQKGAFTESIKKRDTYPLLYNHDQNQIIGFIKVSEDEKGVFARAKLIENDPVAEKVYALLKEGALSEMSIGFGWEDKKDVSVNEDGNGLIFKKTYIREGSVVVTPANPQAIITDVKNAKELSEVDFEEVKKLIDSNNEVIKKWVIDYIDKLLSEETEEGDDSKSREEKLKKLTEKINKKLGGII